MNKVLEVARSEKAIGSGLDAEVSVYVDDEVVRGQLRGMAVDADEVNRLEKVFIVSNVEVMDDAESVRGLAAPGVSVSEVQVEQNGVGKVCIAVRKARGGKCERCWHYCESVGSLSGYPTLCHRCAPVVEKRARLLSTTV